MIVEETKKERKARKKLAKRERRQELLSKLETAQQRPEGNVVASSDAAAVNVEAPAKKADEKPAEAPVQHVKKADVPRGLAKWMVPVARTLDSDRALTATKGSFLIAVNCLMLSVTAHSVYANPEAGPLWLALIPLALTNLLSLAFAVMSSQVRDEPTALDAVLSMPDETYEPALAHLLQNREQLFHTMGNELHLHGSALVKSRRHLRTAYNVLLGGVALTAVTFGLCFAFGAAAPKAEDTSPVASVGGSK